MRKAEQIACLFWILISAGLCVGAVGLKLGSPTDPGPGFLPFGTGALMGILSIVHLLKVSFAPSDTETGGIFWKKANWKRSLSVAVAILFYALILPHLGYLLTTFFLMIVLFSLYERRKWWLAWLSTIFVVLATYLVFHICLKVQFPSGFFGI